MKDDNYIEIPVTLETLEDPDEPGIHPLEAASRQLTANLVKNGIPFTRRELKPGAESTFYEEIERCPGCGTALDDDGKCRACWGDVLGLCCICGSILNADDYQCKNGCNIDVFDEPCELDMPQDYLLNLFGRIIAGAIRMLDEEPERIKELTKIRDSDADPIIKLRICLTSMALFLSYSGVMEQFQNKFKHNTYVDYRKIANKAGNLFDEIVNNRLESKDLPTYVDENYFGYWRQEYTRIVDSNIIYGFQVATLTAFVEQASSSDNIEQSTGMAEDDIVNAGEYHYTIYHNSIRDFVGSNVLAHYANVLIKIRSIETEIND